MAARPTWAILPLMARHFSISGMVLSGTPAGLDLQIGAAPVR